MTDGLSILRAWCLCTYIATPWLLVAGGGVFLLFILAAIRKNRFFDHGWTEYGKMPALKRMFLAFAVGVFILVGGSKEENSSASTPRREMPRRLVQTSPGNASEASGTLSVTTFGVDPKNQSVDFTLAWSDGLFDTTDSRGCYLLMSTNLLERQWLPLGVYAMPLGANANSLHISRENVLPAFQERWTDYFDGIGFFRFGCDSDFDGDGLADVIEQYWTLTKYDRADTDGDGLRDDEELSADVNTDPCMADTDGDGVCDGDELSAGTNAHRANSDRDAFSDAEELGTVVAFHADEFLWLDLGVDAVNLLAGRTDADNETWEISLGISKTINGIDYSSAIVSVDGSVHLLCPTNMEGAWTSWTSPVGMANSLWSETHVSVAICGNDLYADVPRWGSLIRHGVVSVDGHDYAVIEYHNIGLWSRSDEDEYCTCQLILPEDESNTIYVSYLSASAGFREAEFSMGVQCGWMNSWKVGERYYNISRATVAGLPQNGCTLKYTIGTGTDPTRTDTDGDGLSDSDELMECHTSPFVFDTDGDGLCDGEEYLSGSNPLLPDTSGSVGSESGGSGSASESGPVRDINVALDSDSDGMPDSWEIAYGLDPDSSNGEDGASGDPDGDGVSNFNEYLNGSNPSGCDGDGDGVADGFDTDGDGAPDGVEIARGTDPNDPSDGMDAPGLAGFRRLDFSIGGDYAAWEMMVEGLGPRDYRVRRIRMLRPNVSNLSALGMCKGNRYRLSMQWLNCNGHDDWQAPWYCWHAKVDGLPTARSYDDYSIARCEGNEVVVGNGWVVDNRRGLLTSHVHVSTTSSNGDFGGGNIAESLTAILYVLDDPMIIPDYDRNGKIDANDVRCSHLGRVFRFWVNDDEDARATEGKYAEFPKVDIPGARTGFFEFDRRDPDWKDTEVNGIRDLIDFTPLMLDVSCVQILPSHIREMLSFHLAHDEEAVNAVWSGLSADTVGLFQTAPVAVCGRSLNEQAFQSESERIRSSGVRVPAPLTRMMCEEATYRGIVYVEGRRPTAQPLRFTVSCGEEVVVDGELPMKLSPVEHMYRFYSVRGAESGDEFTLPSSVIPENMMEGLSDSTVFFTHGFNVDFEAARAWGSEVFKRLWQSGSNAKFTMVTWAGDYRIGEDLNPLEPMNGFFYHEDVRRALDSARTYKQLIEREEPDADNRILMAQSLGNMMTCEAVRLGLSAGKYLMFNAAVASESVVGRSETPNDMLAQKFVPPAWRSYNPRSWAANWHGWFNSDDRGGLGWRGYFQSSFSRIQQLYNFYSSGDTVLVSSSEVPGALAQSLYVKWPVSFTWEWPFLHFQSFELHATFESHAWQKQEVLKGVNPYIATREGGWGFHMWPVDLENGDVEWVGYSAAQAAELVANCLIPSEPVFERSVDAMFMSSISQQQRNRILAYNIPAVSEAVGASMVSSVPQHAINLNSTVDLQRPNGWGRSEMPYEDRWLHSDMKDMSYYYVYKLYERLVEIIQGGNQ